MCDIIYYVKVTIVMRYKCSFLLNVVLTNMYNVLSWPARVNVNAILTFWVNFNIVKRQAKVLFEKTSKLICLIEGY